MIDNIPMTNRISGLNVADLSVGDLFDKISASFNVHCDTDGSDIILEGDDNLSLLRAEESLKALNTFVLNDSIDGRVADYIIFLARTGSLNEFLSSVDEVYYTTPTGRPVKAKTLGQRIYIDSLKRSELVICSGPAGSGKTFLGVAMAVRAFRNREVSRIILTRPAIEAGERLGFLPGE